MLFPSPIFGPVRSRRLGTSLGINLLPPDGKRCTFDCIYCECGWNADGRTTSPLPSRADVAAALERQLALMAEQKALPDVLTFAGNGEPTLHPDFAAIIDDTMRLRDTYCPEAKVCVLSNATQLHRADVFEALRRVDRNIQKLDTASNEYIRRVCLPKSAAYDAAEVVRRLADFDGHVIVQTMFLQGTDKDGADVGNVHPRYIGPWTEALRRIRPSQVMIYTLDRATPLRTLSKATAAQLDAIAADLRAEGFDVSVSY